MEPYGALWESLMGSLYLGPWEPPGEPPGRAFEGDFQTGLWQASWGRCDVTGRLRRGAGKGPMSGQASWEHCDVTYSWCCRGAVCFRFHASWGHREVEGNCCCKGIFFEYHPLLDDCEFVEGL